MKLLTCTHTAFAGCNLPSITTTLPSLFLLLVLHCNATNATVSLGQQQLPGGSSVLIRKQNKQVIIQKSFDRLREEEKK